MKLAELFEGVTVSVSDKQLTTLDFDGQIIDGDFDCEDNQLTNFKGGPIEVEGNFHAGNNKLTSLDGVASKIKGWFNIYDNKLTSLQGIHKLFKGGYIKEGIDLSGNKIESHLLGLLLIPELEVIHYDGDRVLNQTMKNCEKAIQIINKHLEGDKDVIECQQELIAAGLKAYAQL